jgi:RNA polymerase sigma-70 factor, ECF subfamily
MARDSERRPESSAHPRAIEPMRDAHASAADPWSASFADDLPAEQVSLELLARAKRGDEAALHDLLVRYQDRLHRIVRVQLGVASRLRWLDSMDVVQETFLAALPRIRDLEPRSAGSLLLWLARIATNEILDARDHQHRRRRDARRDVALASTSGEHPAAATAHDPRARAELGEIRQLLDAAVAELGDDQRQVVVLRDYCGESWQGVAAALERGDGAVRQLHQRAWIQLRRKLRPVIERELGPTDRDTGPRRPPVS